MASKIRDPSLRRRSRLLPCDPGLRECSTSERLGNQQRPGIRSEHSHVQWLHYKEQTAGTTDFRDRCSPMTPPKAGGDQLHLSGCSSTAETRKNPEGPVGTPGPPLPPPWGLRGPLFTYPNIYFRRNRARGLKSERLIICPKETESSEENI